MCYSTCVLMIKTQVLHTCMKKFKQHLIEQGFFGNMLNRAKGIFAPQTDPKQPRNGDYLKIFNLYKDNGTYLLSSMLEGYLLINKDGSVHIQFDNNHTSKLANNLQQAKLEPNGPRRWKINRYMQ